MAVVCVRGPLREPAGGRGDHELDGATLIELLRGLERSNPAPAAGYWMSVVLIRRHINVFVNGERGDEQTEVPDDARVDVIPAITGGWE